MKAEKVDIIGLEFSGSLRLFSAGILHYQPEEQKDEWQYSDHSNSQNFQCIQCQFGIALGYLSQQLNAGASYTLADITVIAAAPTTGWVDVANALKDAATDVILYPLLQDGFGNVNTTDKYIVISDNKSINALESKKAGFFNPYTLIKMKLKTPWQSYPGWMNH